MRILFANQNSSFINGLSQAAVFGGHHGVIWNTKPFHIVCKEFSPEIFISNFVSDEMVSYLKGHPEIQSAFKITDEEFDKVSKKIFMSNQITSGIAANLFDGHYPFTKEKKFIACGNLRKTEKSEKLMSGLIDYKSEVPVKLFSNDNWPGEYYCGRISDQGFSTISNLSWFTIHSGELDQSMMNAILCHSLVITDNDSVPFVPIVSSSEEIVSTIKRLNSNMNEYHLLIEQSYKYIIENHTYLHRFDELMKNLGHESNIVNRIGELK